MTSWTTGTTGSASSPLLMLNNGVLMPALGLGVGALESAPGQAAASVEEGLRTGYRLVDTAAVYGNEHEVADGLERSGVPREDVFLTTKLWVTDYGHDAALRSVEESLRLLRTDHVDLYLLHQPLPGDFDATVAAYGALQTLLADGRARAIGVSNFSAAHLADLAARTDVVPAVNQVELHPYFAQPALRRAHAAAGTTTQAWSPIGGVTSWGPGGGRTPGPLADPVVTALAAQLGRTPAQVLLRWHLQHGGAAVTKSFQPERVRENFDVFGFDLTPTQVADLDALDRGIRSGPDPDRPLPRT